MPEICSASFRWTRGELQKAVQHHKRLKLSRGILLAMKVFAVILLAFIAIIMVAWLLFPSTSAPPFWSVALLVLFCLYCLTFDKVNAWRWGRAFSKRPDANALVEWHFSKEEINAQTDLVKATLQWQSFLKVVVTSEGFLFYPLKNFFHWIPFSAFESPECIEKVKAWVRQNDIRLVERK